MLMRFDFRKVKTINFIHFGVSEIVTVHFQQGCDSHKKHFLLFSSRDKLEEAGSGEKVCTLNTQCMFYHY